MNKEAYLNSFRGAIHGSVEIIGNDGRIPLRGTGVFIPSSTRLYAHFSIDKYKPFTIDKYRVLFRPYEQNYILSPVAIYDRFLVSSFHNSTRQYNMSMLLKTDSYDTILKFIQTGATRADIAIYSRPPERITSNGSTLIKSQPLGKPRKYRDGCSISVAALINSFTKKSYNLIAIANSTPFISMQTTREFLNALKLYWYLYHVEHHKLQIASISFKTKDGNNIQLFYSEEQTIDDGGVRLLPLSASPNISARRLHKILSIYLLNNRPKCRGLRYAADEFLKLVTGQSDARGINDYVRQPILVLDSLVTNIEKPSRKRTREQKRKDKQSIQTVLNFINSNRSSLSNDVYKFYSSKTAEQIMGLICRPPFKQKITDILNWLEISDSEFKLSLDDLSRIRSQVVHGQDYDVNYIFDKSITRDVQYIDKREDMTTISLSVQEGIVDTTLKIIQAILAAYFDRRCRYG